MSGWRRAIKPPRRTLRAYGTYRSVIALHLKPALGSIRLQDQPSTSKSPTPGATHAQATGEQHHAILTSALEAALRAAFVQRNVARLASNKPRAPEGHLDVLANCWDSAEASRFLAAAKRAGEQSAAFYSLALETGMRKSELCGLFWADLDWEAGRLTVQRQLVVPGSKPVFGPVKNKQPRVIELSSELLALLKAHKAHQAETKLKNRQHYHDHGLMFAKDWSYLQRRHGVLGDPLQANNLGQREYARILVLAGVRPIKFHGMRHTCATLLLQDGVQPHVVQKRLGHKRIEMTLGIYGHVLPSMQGDAAKRMGMLLPSINGSRTGSVRP